MIEWLATSIMMTPNGVPVEASDAWSAPYVEPIKAERIMLRQGELSKSVVGLKSDVHLVPWMPRVAKVLATVSFRNPGSTWLRWVRIDLEAVDQARLAKPLYTSFLIPVVKPNEAITRTSDRLWVNVGAGNFNRIRYQVKAQVVGAYRLQPPAKP
jgi:hypothetical protein